MASPQFRMQPAKRRAGYDATYATALTGISIGAFAFYVICALALLASTGSIRHPAGVSQLHTRSSSNQHAWYSSRRMQNTLLPNSQQESKVSDQRMAPGGSKQHWADFWASQLPTALHTLQSLRDQVSMAKYQQLTKDLEPQDTAGLDVALSETLHNLAQQTHLDRAQAWLKEQTTSEVFKVLNALQYPPDCASARKLVCTLDKPCGFGCQLHHVVHCFTHTVALNRTMVLQTNPWRYAPQHNGTETWQELMTPVSSCNMHHLATDDVAKLPHITDGHWLDEEQEVALDIIDKVQTSLDIPSMPSDVLHLAYMYNSRPEQWWVGVLASYILRPSDLSQQRHAEFRRNKTWAQPVVGVHIRRTDKITTGEAKLHAVSEYMSHVERYCDWKLGSGWQQRVHQFNVTIGAPQDSSPNCTIYLATDEVKVLDEVRANYPHIHVIINPVALATGNTGTRNTRNGAQGIYDDTLLLASTDYLVGTFSSQVSRLAYEVVQANGSSTQPVTDPSLHYHSVDSMWYFGGMLHYEFCTTHDYTVQGVLQVAAGQHVDCNAMYEFNAGLIKCSLLPNNGHGSVVYLPQALLRRCQSFIQNTYRPLLPQYMQQPSELVETLAQQQQSAAVASM